MWYVCNSAKVARDLPTFDWLYTLIVRWFFFVLSIFGGELFGTSVGHGVLAANLNHFEVNVDSTLGDCGGSLLPYRALEIYDDDNECGVDTRDLVAHLSIRLR